VIREWDGKKGDYLTRGKQPIAAESYPAETGKQSSSQIYIHARFEYPPLTSLWDLRTAELLARTDLSCERYLSHSAHLPREWFPRLAADRNFSKASTGKNNGMHPRICVSPRSPRFSPLVASRLSSRNPFAARERGSFFRRVVEVFVA